MRCYSHLSDDEREQISLSKALGHSIGAIAQAIGRPFVPEADVALRCVDIGRASNAVRTVPHHCCIGAAVAGASGGPGAIVGKPASLVE
jgi:hypothetical protein